MKTNVVGVVPACGVSRRMGRDKALLPFRGGTFLSRAVDALRSGGCDRVFVVVRADRALIRAEAEATGARVVVNPAPGDGPLTSLRRVLTHLEADGGADGVVWLPLDYPLVEPDHVAQLLHGLTPDSGPLVLLVHRGKRGHPAFFGAALFAELSDPDLEGGARTVVRRHLDHARIVDVDDPAVITDVDTPEAYEALLADREGHRV